jgi:hypothetical protein
METTTFVWGTVGTVVGVLMAVGLFALALWLVARARQGNRRVREARDDPHVDHGAHGDGSELARKDHRDISQ